MIKYSLVCDQDHSFESWFPDSASYDSQVKRGFVECPQCQTINVRKAIMAPAITTSGDRGSYPVEPILPARAPASGDASQPMALLEPQQQALRAMLREFHQQLTENTVDVGEKFAEEARRIHEGETPQRSIRGQASLDEARALIEDGISVLPIPALPDDFN